MLQPLILRPRPGPAPALEALRKQENVSPASLLGFYGALSLIVFIGVARFLHTSFPEYVQWGYAERTIYACLATALPMMVISVVFQRVHFLRSAQLDLPAEERRLNIGRSFTKLVGVLGCFGIIAFLYWLFPEYRLPEEARNGFYYTFYLGVSFFAPFFGILAIPYILWTDSRMRDPHDGYWHLGQVVLGLITVIVSVPTFFLMTLPRALIGKHPEDESLWPMADEIRSAFTERDASKLKELIVGWFVKGFFLPLMFLSFKSHISWAFEYKLPFHGAFGARDYIGYDWWSVFNVVGWFEYVWAVLVMWWRMYINNFIHFHMVVWKLLILFDVAFAAVGYAMTFRVFDSHIRSAEPTFLGWFVALMCYQPLWGLVFSKQYLTYWDGRDWKVWFDAGSGLYYTFGFISLFLFGVYMWATISFGLRFSNLTHRGIITHGPYRWMKHPAYVSKNTSWWLIQLPFLSLMGWSEAFRHSLLLLAVNGVYTMRALTEERHLSKDPAYQAYRAFIHEHGLFAIVVRRPLRAIGRFARGERPLMVTTPLPTDASEDTTDADDVLSDVDVDPGDPKA